MTGSRGFIGRNLLVRLEELGFYDILTFNRNDSLKLLPCLVERADSIIHLAGEMRPADEAQFFSSNVSLTRIVCELIENSGKVKPLLLASTIQAGNDSAYGLSKLLAEQTVTKLANVSANAVMIYRLSHVFGRWCRPNYNSVIATFCYNISRDIPVKINDPNAFITPVYANDVVTEFVRAISAARGGLYFGEVSPVYRITVGELARLIYSFKSAVNSGQPPKMPSGFARALFSTYISYSCPSPISPLRAETRAD